MLSRSTLGCGIPQQRAGQECGRRRVSAVCAAGCQVLSSRKHQSAVERWRPRQQRLSLMRESRQQPDLQRPDFQLFAMSASPSANEHRQHAPSQLACAVITVSDTRTLETDKGGALIVELLTAAGHALAEREITPDEPQPMRELIARFAGRKEIDAILLTGGTGITSRDQTFETVSALFSKQIPGYGELFRHLSYAEIGAATILSRAVGGLVGQTVLLTMPGSPAGVRLAMEQIILPELPHLVREARR